MAKIRNNNKGTTLSYDDEVKYDSKPSLEQGILALKAKLAEYDDDGSIAYQNFKTAINNHIKFYQSLIKKINQEKLKAKNTINDSSLNDQTDFKMATNNNNDKQAIEAEIEDEILFDDIQEIKQEMTDPQQRISEFRSKKWLTTEINELTAEINENNGVIMGHEKILLMMEFVYEEERTKENQTLITSIKEAIKTHQQENDINNMLRTLYQGFLQKLD